ncbi:adenosylcobinamide-GDP ribazoletransferase [Blastococcus sp. PRF04-17]|uniref:adenosylcobinamide-GDP ribazoletransferase n=1 Tax=Blastococcus sp. PRF04-17 TaxID=2933797 RepID=UPI001FF55AE7|nr:adenosylcobinamide-GDP ribazoletransferase [Blastococcus sp. PRF04-17]UOY00048.1 adenosylcobinamide-GDP ribazoletransferase [Blastococcus sp. PRF04-17]
MRLTGPLESAALLTVLPVPVRATASTRGVLPWAPLVGLLLGGAATGVAVLGARWVSPLAGAVLAVTVLALLTRGLHLDGLADTADGLGPLRDRDRALQVMHSSDVGPFGVVTVVLVLLLQIACLAALLAETDGWLALWTAVTVARLALARNGLPGVGMAEGSSLGAAVQRTVSVPWFAGSVVVLLGLLALATAGNLREAVALAGSGAAGVLAAELVHRRARRRLGGVTGDVMGAMAETATAATLLVAAVLR